MKYILIAIAFALLVVGGVLQVNAGMKKCESNSTDYTCLQRCQSAGYSYGYCKSICSY